MNYREKYGELLENQFKKFGEIQGKKGKEFSDEKFDNVMELCVKVGKLFGYSEDEVKRIVAEKMLSTIKNIIESGNL